MYANYVLQLTDQVLSGLDGTGMTRRESAVQIGSVDKCMVPWFSDAVILSLRGQLAMSETVLVVILREKYYRHLVSREQRWC